MKMMYLSILLLPTFHGQATNIDSLVTSMNIEIERCISKSTIELQKIDELSRQNDQKIVAALHSSELLECLRINELLRINRKRILFDLSHDISKIRYLKGIQIIRILYEKILSLDHHFASVRTLGEINKVSNPTQYNEYQKLRDMLHVKRDKKNALDLTSVLATNPVVSIVSTFTNMITSNLDKDEKEKELENIECILDFTLRMQNDLNTIYYETAYLNNSNKRIKDEIELLFKEYTKPVNYPESLENCRANDDWDALSGKMEEYLAKMKGLTGAAHFKMQVNLEFPIDRLLQFINQYNDFIDQGGKFYEKFRIILNSYENERKCETKLPIEFQKMKSDIEMAIDKFNVAYKPVEINGSKMKEILYGLNEFE